MRQIADLHIHSRFSRACARDLTIKNIDATCRRKGVDIIATGDFTFPDWFEELSSELEESAPGSGLYKYIKAKDNKVLFVLATELALIYKKNERARRIHMVVQAPSFRAVKELNDFLDPRFNIRSDGRPILGMSIENLYKICLKIDPKFLIYPAHIWTPWFSIFGSKSGFDSLEEAFSEHVSDLYAFETGLSSDPEMNWRLAALDKLTLLSNSDSHSLKNIAREANVFDLTERTYDELFEAIKNKDTKKLQYTIEFYPEEGMYHYDGHRACGVCLNPDETRKNKGICPKCKKKLTVGVNYRVGELADREAGYRPEGVPGYKKLVELDKIIAETLGIKNRTSKKVLFEYDSLLMKGGTEMEILLDLSINDLQGMTLPEIAEGIRRVRSGEVSLVPGYDGEYGKVKIFSGYGSQDGKKQDSFFKRFQMKQVL